MSGKARIRTDSGHHAVLHPAIAEISRRAGADSVALIDVGGAAGLNLNVDRVGLSYSDGRFLGDPASPVQISATIVRGNGVPDRPMPHVVARVGIDADPVDVTDEEDVRRLRPLRAGAASVHEAEIALAATTFPQIGRDGVVGDLDAKSSLLLRGDPLDLLPPVLARVPAGVLPVVTTTWALSAFSQTRRLRFLHRLNDAATARPVAWVSVEGVGVAPAVPTFGDRRASGHSIIGLALFAHADLRIEAVGRCWSRGNLLAWLAGSADSANSRRT